MVIFLPFLLFSPLFILVDGILKTVVIVLLQPNPTYFFITNVIFKKNACNKVYAHLILNQLFMMWRPLWRQFT